MNYWFPAKPSGFGWGPPTNWQGLAFLVCWTGVLLFGSPVLESTMSPFMFFVGMTAVLVLVIFFKGEPSPLR